MTRAVAAIVIVLATASIVAEQGPVYRARTELVAISASVKRGNAPVGNLASSDFALFDEDVPQTIDALTIESVPLDVTLFMDTSGSTAGSLDQMKRNVSSIAAMLRAEDRFRLITIGLSVETPVPWRAGGRGLTLDMQAVPGISLVYDALAVALAYEPEPGRRHLIVAMTDGEDCGSVLDGARVLDMSARSEAVLHWIWVSNSGGDLPFGVSAWCTPGDARETDYVGLTAERTGGDRHRSHFGDPAVRTFRQILDEFRQSYVLRYSPSGVKPGGWHRVRVTVPAQPTYTINFRSGYFSGEPKLK
jgi:VWFA-related protein